MKHSIITPLLGIYRVLHKITDRGNMVVGARLNDFHARLSLPSSTGTTSLIQQTGVTSSTSASILMCLDALDAGVSTVLNAYAAKQKADLANMISLEGVKNETKTCLYGYKNDVEGLQKAEAELEKLKERKDAAKSEKTRGSLQAEVDKFDKTNPVIQKFNDFKSAIANKTTTLKTASDINRNIALCDSTINKPISASSLSVIGQKLAANVNSMKGPGVVDLIKNAESSSYGKETLKGTFEQDLKMAAKIDEQLTAKQKAEKEKADLLNGLPNLDGITKPTDLDGLDKFYSQVENALKDMESTEIEDNEGNKTTLKEYGEKKDKLDQANGDAAGTSDIDAQIAAKEKEIAAAKKKVNAHKEKLEKAKEVLTKAVENLTSTIDTRAAMNSAKSDYKAERNARRKDQNFFQKLFARGKTVDEKATKGTYDNKKGEFNAANNTMNTTYIDAESNDKKLIEQRDQLSLQLVEVEKALGKIEEMTPKDK